MKILICFMIVFAIIHCSVVRAHHPNNFIESTCDNVCMWYKQQNEHFDPHIDRIPGFKPNITPKQATAMFILGFFSNRNKFKHIPTPTHRFEGHQSKPTNRRISITISDKRTKISIAYTF